MEIPSSFKVFDPLKGAAPTYPFSLLRPIVSRARRLLAGRTREQIFSASRSIDWFIEEYFQSEKEAFVERLVEHGGWELRYLNYEDRHEGGIRYLLDNWPHEADDRPDFPTSENTLEVDALRECIGSYVLADDEEFPNGRESEYFAVLALRQVADAISWLRPAPGERFRDVPPDLQADAGAAGFTSERPQHLALAADRALEAMDTLCEGEHLHATERMTEEATRLRAELLMVNAEIESIAHAKVKERVSVAASKAAIMRHAENRAMKAQVFAWCDENMTQFQSMDRAAESIAGKLVPVAFRTARDWIGAWRKERSARRP